MVVKPGPDLTSISTSYLFFSCTVQGGFKAFHRYIITNPVILKRYENFCVESQFGRNLGGVVISAGGLTADCPKYPCMDSQ